MKMEYLYTFLQSLGYDHPVHPAFAHMPTGLVVGAFIFLIAALFFKRLQILTTSYHCIILALIFLFPTAFFGYTDWHHFYRGEWSFPIKVKITLTSTLLIFLATAIIMEVKKIGGLMSRSVIYFLCVVAVVGLGYFGGDLVFPDTSPALSNELQAGENSMRLTVPVVIPMAEIPSIRRSPSWVLLNSRIQTLSQDSAETHYGRTALRASCSLSLKIS